MLQSNNRPGSVRTVRCVVGEWKDHIVWLQSKHFIVSPTFLYSIQFVSGLRYQLAADIVVMHSYWLYYSSFMNNKGPFTPDARNWVHPHEGQIALSPMARVHTGAIQGIIPEGFSSNKHRKAGLLNESLWTVLCDKYMVTKQEKRSYTQNVARSFFS